MTVTRDGVTLSFSTRKRIAVFFVLCAEALLSFLVYVSLSAHILWPEKTKAVEGVANVLSYEGRLTDENGVLLGGTGEPYCFRFSIYEDLSGGTKVWPSGTPNTTIATTTDGVFNALIGQADTLDINFAATTTLYLSVDVNTSTSTNGSTCSGSWETLSPRQRIAAAGYARSAESIYSSLLETDFINSRVQVGSGTGSASPKYLGLDVKNTADYIGESCTTPGTVWYNSAISKALVCENSVIQAISNAGATTTIAAITANAGTPATTGTVVFSNSNGVTFGVNGNTITASVAAAGGSTLSSYVNQMPASTGSQTLGAMGVTSGSALFFPVSIATAVHFNALRIPMNFSYATSTVSGRQTLSHSFGLYSSNGSSLSLISSNSLSYAVTNSSVSATVSVATATATTGYGYGTLSASTTAQIHSHFGTRGLRAVDLQFGNTMSLSPGMYWLGYLRRESSSSANIGFSVGLAGNVVGPINSVGRLGSHSDSLTTNFGLKVPFMGLGPYTSTGSAGYGGSALPSSVFLSGIAHTGSQIPFMIFVST